MSVRPLGIAAIGTGVPAQSGAPRGAAGDSLVLVPREDFSDLAGEWRSLAGRAAEDNVFHGPELVSAAADHLVPGLRLAILRTPDGRLAGLAPLHPTRLGRLAPAVAGLSHDYGPFGVPPVDPAQADAMAGGLIAAAEAMGGPRAALVMPMIPAAGPLAAALRRRAAAEDRALAERPDGARAILDLHSDGEDPRVGLPRRRRKEYARQLRRLADLGTVTFGVAATPGEVPLAFAEFLALEAGGWKGRRGTALAHQPAAGAFARLAVDGLAGRGACRILSLRVDGRPAAMLVCFLGARTATTWKIAFDEAFAAYSPGAQLMLEAPRLLFAVPGITRIDSLAAPGHPMIDHLWPGRLALTTLAIAPARGRALFRAGLLARSAEDGARALARRLRSRLKAGRAPVQGDPPDEPSAA